MKAAIEKIPDSALADRVNTLEERYGHVNDHDIIRKDEEFTLHLCVDRRAVNQGLCQIKKNENLYYVKARSHPTKLPGTKSDEIPKDLIMMEIEKPITNLGYQFADIFVTGIITSMHKYLLIEIFQHLIWPSGERN